MRMYNLLLLLAVLTPSSLAAEQGGVNFVDGQAPLIVTLGRVPEQSRIRTEQPAKSDATITLMLRNDDPHPQAVKVSVKLQDKHGDPVEAEVAPETLTLSAGSAQQASFAIKVASPKSVLSGYLLLEARRSDQSDAPAVIRMRPIQMNPPRPASATNNAIWGAAALSLLSTLISVLAIMWMWGLRTLKTLKTPMGTPTWDFSQSWAANLTVIGGALTALLSFTGLPDQGQLMTKTAYLCLGVLFTAMLVLAPPLFNFLRRPISVAIPDPENPLNMTGLRFQGFVGGFLTATFVLLWGVFGQLITLGILFAELEASDFISKNAMFLLESVLTFLVVALLVYGPVSSTATIKRQKKACEERDQWKKKTLSGEQTDTTEAPKMPKWHVM
jgi:hypothetical protein